MTPAALLGLGLTVFAAVSLVVIGDTAGKLLTGAGTAPLFVAWSRFAIAALVLLPFSGLRRDELRLLLAPRLWLRAALIVGGISCILTALRTEPIANVFGAFFVGPIVSWVLAVLFLGERFSGARAALLACGFAGVMVVVRPGFGATPGMAFAVAAGCFYGGYLAMTRVVASDYRPRFLLLSQLLIGAALLTPAALAVDWPAAEPGPWSLVTLSALASAAGNYLLVMANRRAEASLIAPLVYTQLISATILGVVVFGDWPDPLALAGLAVIAASGAGSLFVRGRAPDAAPGRTR